MLFKLILSCVVLISSQLALSQDNYYEVYELEPDSIFVCRRSKQDYTIWELHVKHDRGFDTLQLNDPFDAMGIDHVEPFYIECPEEETRLIAVNCYTTREHSYGGSGGWDYSKYRLVVFNPKTHESVLDFIYYEQSSEWNVIEDSTSEESADVSESYAEFSYELSIDSLGNVLFLNYSESDGGPSELVDSAPIRYIFTNGRYARIEEE